MVEHELKILPQYFNAVVDGTKTFELRKNDRDYNVGDSLVLKEYGIGKDVEGYSGNEVKKEISYILKGGQYGLDKEYCIIGFKDIKPKDVFVNIIEFQSENLKGIPIPCIFSSYEKLIKFEDEIMYRKDVKTLNITRCEVDKHLK